MRLLPSSSRPRRSSTSTRSASATTTTSRCAATCRSCCRCSWAWRRSRWCAWPARAAAGGAWWRRWLACVPVRGLCATRAPLVRHRDWDGAVNFVAGRGAALRSRGRAGLRAAQEHPPALAAAMGRPRADRAGDGALQARPRPAAAPGAGLAAALPQHLLRAHLGLRIRPVRRVPGARADVLVRHLGVGARVRRASRGEPSSTRSHFTVSRVVPPDQINAPPLPLVDVGGTDDVQVSGFYDKRGRRRPHRTAGPAPARPCTCRACGPARRCPCARRPAGGRPRRPAVVTASLDGAPLGQFTSGPEWSRACSGCRTRCRRGPRVLRLDVPAWHPSTLDPTSADERDLGVMVDRLRFAIPFPACPKAAAVDDECAGGGADLQRAGERPAPDPRAARPGRARSTCGWPTTAAPTAPATRCARPWPARPGRVELLRPRARRAGAEPPCIAAFKKGLADPRRYRRLLRDGRRLLPPPARDPGSSSPSSRRTTW